MGAVSEGAVEAWAGAVREEWPQLMGAALGIVGDLQTAEEVAQETLLVALDRWPLLGVPERPGAWLMPACRNRARNVVRDAGRGRQRHASLWPLLSAPPVPGPALPDAGAPEIADDRLRLIAMCCHPLLSTDGQVALTLRMVAGLTTQEIARAFHLPATPIAQRIGRAKPSLKQHRVPLPSDDPDVPGRLASILDVIYLIFNERYLPTPA